MFEIFLLKINNKLLLIVLILFTNIFNRRTFENKYLTNAVSYNYLIGKSFWICIHIFIFDISKVDEFNISIRLWLTSDSDWNNFQVFEIFSSIYYLKIEFNIFCLQCFFFFMSVATRTSCWPTLRYYTVLCAKKMYLW